MHVRCGACETKVRLSAEIAAKQSGKKIKCPKCAAAIDVPRLRKAKPLEPASEPSSGMEFASTERPAPRSEPAASADVGPLPASSAPVAPTDPVGPVIVTDSPPALRPRNRTAKATGSKSPGSRGRKGWMIGIAATTAVTAAAFAMWMLLFSGGSGASAGGGASARGQGELVLRWSSDERQSASLLIDQETVQLPADEDLRYKLSAGQHELLIRRRGFEPIKAQVVVTRNSEVVYTPRWSELSSFARSSSSSATSTNSHFNSSYSSPAGSAAVSLPELEQWNQDLAAAKAQARRETKDLLLVFVGSDWDGASQEFIEDVARDAHFLRSAHPQYVPVFIDQPRTSAGRQRVQNAARNRKLARQFSVEEVPTILLADDQGVPYAYVQYGGGSSVDFLSVLDRSRQIRNQRDVLYVQADESEGREKALAAASYAKLLSELGVLAFYEPVFQHWLEEARQFDPQNRSGLQEVFFEFWLASSLLKASASEPDSLPQISQQLFDWDDAFAFRDVERAARLFLTVAIVLQETAPEQVERFASVAIEYAPEDEDVRALYELLQNGDVLGTGTGFLVSSVGHVLTNYHVVEGPGAVVVKFPDTEQEFAAEVVLTNSQHDLALLKIAEIPQGAVKLRFAESSPSRGTEVGAFGYPLSSQLGNALKLTRGIVSATAEQTPRSMMLLDCRINPGNSGGPLCNEQGEVVGIVTAKSQTTEVVDSYGMAIPIEQIRSFLGGFLSKTELGQNGSTRAYTGDGGWAAVDQVVSGSVVLVEKKTPN